MPVLPAPVRALLLALTAAVGGAGCDTFFGEGERPALSYQQACFQVAEAHCAKLTECNPFVLQAIVADRSCVERLRLQCPTREPPAGSNQTATITAACARGIAALTCADHVVDRLPAECAPPGQLAAGKPCSFDLQCASAYCQRAAGASCGVCATLAPVGAACQGTRCAPGLTCHEGTCAAPAARGAPCSATVPCQHGSYCNGTSCVAWQTTAGAACDKDRPASCSVAHGVYCNPQTSRCQTLGLAPAGGKCGVDPLAALCPLTFACTAPANVCPALANDGQACDASRVCRPPAECVAGVCRLSSADACPAG